MEKQGRDVQLEKAVEVLMDKVSKNPRKYDYELPVEKR